MIFWKCMFLYFGVISCIGITGRFMGTPINEIWLIITGFLITWVGLNELEFESAKKQAEK